MALGTSKLAPESFRQSIKENNKARNTVLAFYRPYLRFYLRFKTWKEFGRYHHAEIDPYRIVWISPEDIKEGFQDNGPFNCELSPKIVGGDWDTRTQKFEELPRYRSIFMHFEQGEPWENTPLYSNALEAIENDESYDDYDCSCIEELKEQLEKIDELYEQIKNRGYLTQHEIENKEIGKPHKSHNINYYLGSLNEIIVNIGRDGEIIFHEGRHRLSIAKIQGINKVPVRILIRHRKWQNVRDKAASDPDSVDKEYLSHPDVDYLLN